MTESADKTNADEVVVEETDGETDQPIETISHPAFADEGDGKFNPLRDEQPMTKEQRDAWYKENPGGRLAELSWPDSSSWPTSS